MLQLLFGVLRQTAKNHENKVQTLIKFIFSNVTSTIDSAYKDHISAFITSYASIILQ